MFIKIKDYTKSNVISEGPPYIIGQVKLSPPREIVINTDHVEKVEWLNEGLDKEQWLCESPEYGCDYRVTLADSGSLIVKKEDAKELFRIMGITL